MHDSSRMDVIQNLQESPHDLLDVRHSIFFVFAQFLQQISPSHQVHNQINAVGGLVNLVDFNNIRVVELFGDRDLVYQSSLKIF